MAENCALTRFRSMLGEQFSGRTLRVMDRTEIATVAVLGPNPNVDRLRLFLLSGKPPCILIFGRFDRVKHFF